MKILYLANTENKKYPTSQIEKALKQLGHKVKTINELDFRMEELIEKGKEADLFLFHSGGVLLNNEYEFQLSLTRLQNILNHLKCKKVVWCLDKIWGNTEMMLEQIIPFLDYAFLNDDTWVRRHKYPNVFCLHMGAEYRQLGKYKKEYDVELAFIGTVYGARKIFIEALRQEFGRKFKVFYNIWDKKFDDLCESAKFIIAPRFPQDDFYWSDRIYRVLASGGFLLHPKLQGLEEEGFVNGKHYIAYTMYDELLEAIKYFSKKEKDEEYNDITLNGRDFVNEKFSYEQRLKTLLTKLNKKNGTSSKA